MCLCFWYVLVSALTESIRRLGAHFLNYFSKSFSKLLRDIGNGLAGAVLVVVQGNKFHFQDPVDTLFLRARQVGAATRQHYEVVVFDILEGEIDKAVVI